MTILQVICAWCGRDLGTKDGRDESGVTHGICPSCKEQYLAALADLLKSRRSADLSSRTIR